MNANKKLEAIRDDYARLLAIYREEEKEIQNIDELFVKYRNLKIYEAEYDKNQQLKKELQFWNSCPKSQTEILLEQRLHSLLQHRSQ